MDHTVFMKHHQGKVTTLIVYVDDIVVTSDDHRKIKHLKDFTGKEIEIKDLGLFKYFLGIKIAKSNDGLYLSQRKYVSDLPQDSRMLRCKPCDTPIEYNHHQHADEGHRLLDIGCYQRLVGKLLYLILTKLDIFYEVGVVNQFMHASTTKHLEGAYCIAYYSKKSLGQGHLYRRRHDLRVKAMQIGQDL